MNMDIAEIVRHFQLEGEYLDGAPYGSGHINDTFRTRWRRDGREVPSLQQRINHRVFRDPARLMENVLRVTRHLAEKLSRIPGADPRRETLTVIPARDGRPCHVDAGGNTWRTYIFIEDARSYDICQGPEQAEEAARAFGRFQNFLADLPGGPLHETIPFFHHTPRRFEALEKSIEADVRNRALGARAEIEFALAHKGMTARVTDLLESGALPVRTTHNDCKLNNVLLDDGTGKGVCVIDLDTVMSGSALYDFGDMVRTFTPTAAEDETDLGRVGLRMDIFDALVRGYLREATFLVPEEIGLLSFAGPLITFTIGIRFLADYLQGDVYFKTHRPDHNLDRARVQFRMVAEMESREAEMQTLIRRYASLC